MNERSENSDRTSNESSEPTPPLAVDEATMAALLGISPEHLGNLTREGLVPFLKLGRRTLFSVRAMDAFLFEQAMRNTKAAEKRTE